MTRQKLLLLKKKMAIFREEATSAEGDFQVRPTGRIRIWKCWKPAEEGENQKQIQPTYGNGPESNWATLVLWWEASALTTAPSLLLI